MNHLGCIRGLWSRGGEKKNVIVEASFQFMIDELRNVYHVAFGKAVPGRVSNVSKDTEMWCSSVHSWNGRFVWLWCRVGK